MIAALPGLAHVGGGFHHGLARFAVECLGKLGHVYDDSVDAKARRRVGVDHGAHAQVFGTLVGAVPLRESDEETLLRGQTVAGLKFVVLRVNECSRRIAPLTGSTGVRPVSESDKATQLNEEQFRRLYLPWMKPFRVSAPSSTIMYSTGDKSCFCAFTVLRASLPATTKIM